MAIIALLISGCSGKKANVKTEKNRAIQFSGKNYEALSINNANSFNIDSFKIVADITTYSNKTGNDVIFRLGNGSGKEGYTLHINKNNKLTLDIVGSNGNTLDTVVFYGVHISNNKKYNIELSLNNKNGELVINNVVQGFQLKNSIVHPSNPVALIGANDNKKYSHLFSGTIDNFAFYDSKNKLILKYDFEKAGRSAGPDKSGNNHNFKTIGKPKIKFEF